MQLAGGEGLVPALHEVGLGGHLLRDAGRQGVQHQGGLQRHGDQARRPHRQSVQVCLAHDSSGCGSSVSSEWVNWPNSMYSVNK